jgi:hypothetical protein
MLLALSRSAAMEQLGNRQLVHADFGWAQACRSQELKYATRFSIHLPGRCGAIPIAPQVMLTPIVVCASEFGVSTVPARTDDFEFAEQNRSSGDELWITKALRFQVAHQ